MSSTRHNIPTPERSYSGLGHRKNVKKLDTIASDFNYGSIESLSSLDGNVCSPLIADTIPPNNNSTQLRQIPLLNNPHDSDMASVESVTPSPNSIETVDSPPPGESPNMHKNRSNSLSIASVESIVSIETVPDALSPGIEDGNSHSNTQTSHATLVNTPQKGGANLSRLQSIGDENDMNQRSKYDLMGSEFIYLLQLSTYSTFYGPYPKYVWRNNFKIMRSPIDESLRSKKNTSPHSQPSVDASGDDSKTDNNANLSEKERKKITDHSYAELEGFIAKQTLDGQDWKKTESGIKPPPFTKRNQAVPEFGVVLSCISFDSSISALQAMSRTACPTPSYSSLGSIPSPPNDVPNPSSNAKHHSHISENYDGRPPPTVTAAPDNVTPNTTPPNGEYPPYYSNPYNHRVGTGSSGSGGSGIPQPFPQNHPTCSSPEMDDFVTISGSVDSCAAAARASMQPPPDQELIFNPDALISDTYEDPSSVQQYSLVLAIPFNFYHRFVEISELVDHWLYVVASHFRYLFALNRNQKILNSNGRPIGMDEEDDDISGVMPFLTSIVPQFIERFDGMFDAKLPTHIALSDTLFSQTVDDSKKSRLAKMITSHLQTLGRSVIIGNNVDEINRYIYTLSMFSTQQQRNLSRLCVKVDNPNNLVSHYIPELYLQGLAVDSHNLIGLQKKMRHRKHVYVRGMYGLQRAMSGGSSSGSKERENNPSNITQPPMYNTIHTTAPAHIPPQTSVATAISAAVGSPLTAERPDASSSPHNHGHKDGKKDEMRKHVAAATLGVGTSPYAHTRTQSGSGGSGSGTILDGTPIITQTPRTPADYMLEYLSTSPAIIKLQEELYLAPGPSTLIILHSRTQNIPRSKSHARHSGHSHKKRNKESTAKTPLLHKSPDLSSKIEQVLSTGGAGTDLFSPTSSNWSMSNNIRSKKRDDKTTSRPPGHRKRRSHRPRTNILETSSIRQTLRPHKFPREQQTMLFQKLLSLRPNSFTYHLKQQMAVAAAAAASLHSKQATTLEYNIGETDEKETECDELTTITTLPLTGRRSSQLHRTRSSSSPSLTSISRREKEAATGKKGRSLNEITTLVPDESAPQLLPLATPPKRKKRHSATTVTPRTHRNHQPDHFHSSARSGYFAKAATIEQQSTAADIYGGSSHHLQRMGYVMKNLIRFEPDVSPTVECIVFGAFGLPMELKITFLETQFRILLQRASEILIYIEDQCSELLSFYDRTSHITNCKEFENKIPMEAVWPQTVQKFESQLRRELDIWNNEDFLVFLSIAESFRPHLYLLMFGNPVFDHEVEDVLRYFLF